MGALVGEIVGNYRITDQIGTGGMGAVYRAEHVLLGKSAAVKVLLPERSQSQEIVERFFNEAKAASLIRDPGIVEIFDFGRLPDGNAYIVMELLEGETLGERLRREGRLSANRAVSIVRHVAGTLAAAHKNGIIHRDLKPDNIFLVKDPAMPRGERAKLLDFGIAKLATGNKPSDLVKTETGRLMGTPYYMSPEQCRGAGRVDHRTDTYSLGCVLYQMLTGRPPFVLEGAGEILAAHIHVPPTPPRAHEPDVPAALEAVVLRMIAKEPSRRYQDMEEVVEALNEVVPRFAGEEEPEPSLASSDRFRNRAGTRPLTPPVVTEATTLNSTSGEIATAPTQDDHPRAWRRAAPYLAATALALGAGAAVAFAVASRQPERADGAEPTEPVAVEPAALPVALADASAPAPIVRSLPEQAPSAEPEQVKLLILSDPDGAVVYREADGVRLGRTPLSVRARRGRGEAAFIIRKSGYRNERVAVPVAEDQEIVVTLRSSRSAREPADTPGEVPTPTVTSTPTGGAAPAAGSAPTPEDGAMGTGAPKGAPKGAAKGEKDGPDGRDGALNPFNDLLHRAKGEP
ncbi:MAG TPA: protein kinase [Kofleriaceae bacterium]|nr:protein kinase [Kofleriaceae bacterium]